jgi:hypothetical protein
MLPFSLFGQRWKIFYEIENQKSFCSRLERIALPEVLSHICNIVLKFTPLLLKELCAIDDEYCKGRILAMGGGGYNLTNLALAWNSVLEAMLE